MVNHAENGENPAEIDDRAEIGNNHAEKCNNHAVDINSKLKYWPTANYPTAHYQL